MENNRTQPAISPFCGATQSGIFTRFIQVQLSSNLCCVVLIFCFILIRVLCKYQIYQIEKIYNSRQLSLNIAVIVCFLIGVVLTPILAVVLSFFLCYRLIVHAYLNCSVGVYFSGLLKGPDVFWAMEHPEARSIITVLTVLEVPLSKCSALPEDLLVHKLRKVALKSLLAPTSVFPKLMHLRRKSRLGYYYWVTLPHLDVNKFVRDIDITDDNSGGLLSQLELERIIGKHCNEPLPYNDTATWEILVGQRPLQCTREIPCFPILFRIHHSVGDGVALLRVFLEGFADSNIHQYPPVIRRQSSGSNSIQISDKIEENSENEPISDSWQSTIAASITDANSPSVHYIKKSTCQYETVSAMINGDQSRVDLKNIIGKKFVDKFSILKKSRFLYRTPKKEEPIVVGSKQYQREKLLNIAVTAPFVSSFCRTEGPKLMEKNNSTVSPPPLSAFSQQEPFILQAGAMVGYDKSINVRRRATFTGGDKVKAQFLEQLTPGSSVSTQFERCSKYSTELIEFEPSSGNSTIAKFNVPTLKDLVIYFVVIVIVSCICIKRSVETLVKMMAPVIYKISKFIIYTPYVLYSNMFGISDDRLLYGTPLSGQKVVSFITETVGKKTEKRFMAKIRKLRKKYKEPIKFSHVIMTCLSRSLHSFYKRRCNVVPSFVNVVLPIRVDIGDMKKIVKNTSSEAMTAEGHNMCRQRVMERCGSTSSDSEQEVDHIKGEPEAELKGRIMLDNKFTVAMMKLPIDCAPLYPDTPIRSVFNDVRDECNRMSDAPDYLVNYWLLRWVAHLVPVPILQPCLSGAPCSLVLSNLPGPEDSVRLAGGYVRDIVFWLPNRGLSGVGIGMLTYCGRISLGIVADKALISDECEAREIISGIIDEVDLFSQRF